MRASKGLLSQGEGVAETSNFKNHARLTHLLETFLTHPVQEIEAVLFG